MKDSSKISDAEWKVINVLWSKSPLSANGVIKALSAEHWKPKTVRTLINRLVGKGVVGVNKDKREHEYYPLVKEDECVKAETTSFLNRIRTKALKPILAAFIEQEQLSGEEIDELKKILDNKSKN